MLSEITAGGAGGGDMNGTLVAESSVAKKRKNNEEQLNTKIKQWFQRKSEIKPFYTGGKISVLSECHFACKCDTAVNVVSTSASLKKSKTEGENDADPDEDEDTVAVEPPSDAVGTKLTECFQIISHLEVEHDEIIAFDACPSSHIIVTSHKSTLIRVWDLNKAEVIKTVKSLHNLPIGLLEIHKTRARKSLQDKLKSGSPKASEAEDDVTVCPTYEEAVLSIRQDLLWATIAGASLRIWEFGGNQMSKTIPVGNIASIGYARWGEDDSAKTLFIAERNIYVIESEKDSQYKINHSLEGHYSQVTGIEFAKDGNTMVSGGRDKVLILWDIAKAEGSSNIKSISKIRTVAFPESIESLVLTSPTDLYVTLAPSDIRHYDIQKNSLAKSSVLKQQAAIDEPIVSFFAPLSSTSDDDETVKTRDYFFAATHSSVMFRLEPTEKKVLDITKQYVGCLDEILCVVFWGSPETIAVTNNTNIIKVYTLPTAKCDFLRGHKDIVLALDVHKEWLISGSKDNSVILWKKGSGTPHLVLEGHLASVTGVCFNRLNSSSFYSVSEDNFLKSWEHKGKSKGSCLNSQLAHDKEIHSVNCSPNGALLITSSRDKTAKVWDTETLKLVSVLKGHKKSVWDARFSSWDQLAVTSSADTTIKVWNLVSFACIQTLQGHVSSVLQVMFANLGLQLVSTSSDGTLRVWDLKSSLCVATEECSNDKIWTVDAQPDLSCVVTGSADSVITVWEDITEEKVKEGQAKRRKFLEDEQKLSNVMRSGKWEEAFKLAIELERPHTLLKIVRELKDPLKQLNPIVRSLTQDLKTQLLDYIRKWNTNTKTSTEAQYLLNTILKTTPFQVLEKEAPTEALVAYTQKHYNRVKTHRERMAVIQYFANKEDAIS